MAFALLALTAVLLAAGWWMTRSPRTAGSALAPSTVVALAGVPLFGLALVLALGRGDPTTAAGASASAAREPSWAAADVSPRGADAQRTDRSREGTSVSAGRPPLPADPLAATAAALAETSAARRSAAPAAGPDIEAMLARLSDRLARQPDDATGWLMLAHSNASLERYPAAVKAYAEAARLLPQDAQVLADWADALAMSQGRRAAGEPTRLLDRALALDPRNLKARVMAGSAALERGDRDAARRHFEAARAEAPAGGELARAMDGQIAALQAAAGDARSR